MQNKFIPKLAFITTVVLISSCSVLNHSGGSAVIPGSWQQQPIAVDGDSKDWPSPYPNYDSKAMVAYATSNDGQNLYISVQTGDKMTQLKILKRGLTVSIDTNGKKDTQFNINYPLQNDNEPLDLANQNIDSRSPLSNRQNEQKINKLMQEANQFSLDGFADCSGGYQISQVLPCGVQVKARIDEYNELVWEAAIPFRAIFNRENLTAADANRPISVSINVKSFKSNSPKNASNTNTGTNDGMGGAGSNSSMRGGGGNRQTIGRTNTTDPLQHLYDNTKTWKRFGLAVKP